MAQERQSDGGSVDLVGVRTTEFDLKRDRAEELYESGRRAAEAFLASWCFDAYKAAFRAGAAPGRRQTVGEVTPG